MPRSANISSALSISVRNEYPFSVSVAVTPLSVISSAAVSGAKSLNFFETQKEDLSAETDAENKDKTTDSKTEESSSKTESNNSYYVLLADGSSVGVGGDIPLSALDGASFVIGGSETVWFAAIGSPGVYRLSSDPEANWAFESQYSAGTKVPLAPYVGYFSDPSYDYLTIELRGNSDKEYSFHITR